MVQKAKAFSPIRISVITLAILVAIAGHYYHVALRSTQLVLSYSDIRRPYFLLIGAEFLLIYVYGFMIQKIPWFKLTNSKGQSINLKRDLQDIPRVAMFSVEGAKARLLASIVIIVMCIMMYDVILEMATVLMEYY